MVRQLYLYNCLLCKGKRQSATAFTLIDFLAPALSHNDSQKRHRICVKLTFSIFLHWYGCAQEMIRMSSRYTNTTWLMKSHKKFDHGLIYCRDSRQNKYHNKILTILYMCPYVRLPNPDQMITVAEVQWTLWYNQVVWMPGVDCDFSWNHEAGQ